MTDSGNTKDVKRIEFTKRTPIKLRRRNSNVKFELHYELPHVKCSSDEDGSKVTAALLLLKYYYYVNHTSFGQPKNAKLG